MSNILEVHGLNKSYETFSTKNVSFNIPTGYIMGFIGPNGADKTTTIKAILNMISYQSGEFKLFGLENKDDDSRIYEQIGVVMDSPFYSNDWTAADVEAVVSPFYPAWDSRKYANMLGRFSLDKKKKVKLDCQHLFEQKSFGRRKPEIGRCHII